MPEELNNKSAGPSFFLYSYRKIDLFLWRNTNFLNKENRVPFELIISLFIQAAPSFFEFLSTDTLGFIYIVRSI